ncbi:sensor histidine kinase [Rehaibacterium terrae]|jgi:PAS domain S-box-containing protein|uniref:histidine kinase n=1 Tax=Rehaibacterium terrae TaxID=1341696 RepID=A0A7W7V6R9_9GAMM|nr:ATP-binding protein [Rehaibacterium terrae]MBB5014208.1 PAS domain S-box-containing protein [Rehaibacterium terrae]
MRVGHGSPATRQFRPHLRRWTLVAFLLAFVLFGLAAWRTYQHSRAVIATDAWVRHTLLVLQEALAFEDSVARMEAEHRGFLITGDRALEAARDRHHAQARRELVMLRERLRDAPPQLARVESIQALLDARIAVMREASQLVARDGLDAGRAHFQTIGVALIAPVHALVEELRRHEEAVLGERARLAAQNALRLQTTLAYGPLIGIALMALGLVALLRELRRGERTQRALAEANALQRAILESAGHMIIACRPDGIIRLFNCRACEQLGYTAEEMVGRQTPAVFHDADEVAARAAELSRELGEPIAPGFEAFVARPRRGEVDKRIWTYVRRDGSRFPVELTITPVHDDTGSLLGFVGVAQDIGERLAAEREVLELNRRLQAKAEQLEQTNRELESFSYSVSHDLRAPLRHIDGYARMLAEDLGDRLDPEPRRYLQAIADSARRMGVLIDDLLALSRLGRKPLAREPVDMRALAEEALRDVPRHAATIDIGDLPPASGDPALLKQVWINLLSNALKYSAPRGEQARVEVSGRREHGRVRYRVRDNGVGFDMRYADKLFGVFQRLHPQDRFEGTGVGLAIVHRIVTRHGGHVGAEAAPDQGACFEFDLPAP